MGHDAYAQEMTRQMAKRLFEAARDGMMDAGAMASAHNSQAVVEFAKAVATAALAEAVQKLEFGDEVAEAIKDGLREVSTSLDGLSWSVAADQAEAIKDSLSNVSASLDGLARSIGENRE